MSRKESPKQLLPLTSNRSMLVETLQRLNQTDFERPIIVGAGRDRAGLEREVARSGMDVEAILIEPVGRSTSAAATLAAEWLRSTERDEVLLLMPADHAIGNPEALHAAIRAGAPHAESGAIVTFGIVPAGASTEYGYIEIEAPTTKDMAGAHRVARFVEKPDAAAAAEYANSGRFFWNSGMFLVKASTWIDEMREFMPASLDAISHSLAAAARDGIFIRPKEEFFSEAENISIDYGIMEKTSRAVVIPVEMDWSDVGSWQAVWKLAPKDGHNNAVLGNVVAIDTRDSLLRNESTAIVATIGLENIAVIAVADAILITPLNRAADVKLLVEKLRAEGQE